MKVHGIVLSAGCDIVTVVDFGVSTAKSQKNNKVTESQELEDMIDKEDQAMVEACEKYRKDHLGADRVNILTLTDEKEIKRWKKVQYGENLEKQKDWRWWKKTNHDEKLDHAEFEESQTKSNEGESETNTERTPSGDDEIPKNADLHPKQGTNWWNCKSPQSQSPPKETNVKRETKDKLPALPASDPEHLVLSRVRFLLNNPQELPPHHILFSNSECIAVWCKTGEFMTMN